MNGSSPLDARPGRPTVLIPSQEEVLSQHVKYLSTLGYAYTQSELIQMAESVIPSGASKSHLSKHWFYGFMSRHKDLVSVTPQKLDRNRLLAQQKGNISTYFDKLKTFLLDVPEAIM